MFAWIEKSWAIGARILAFFFGGFLIYGQSRVPNPPGAQESILLVAVGLMGPLGASVFAAMVTAGHEKSRKADSE